MNDERCAMLCRWTCKTIEIKTHKDQCKDLRLTKSILCWFFFAFSFSFSFSVCFFLCSLILLSFFVSVVRWRRRYCYTTVRSNFAKCFGCQFIICSLICICRPLSGVVCRYKHFTFCSCVRFVGLCMSRWFHFIRVSSFQRYTCYRFAVVYHSLKMLFPVRASVNAKQHIYMHNAYIFIYLHFDETQAQARSD